MKGGRYDPHSTLYCPSHARIGCVCRPFRRAYRRTGAGRGRYASDGRVEILRREPGGVAMSEVERQCDEVQAKMRRLFKWAPDKQVFDEIEMWYDFIEFYRHDEEFIGDCDDFMLTAASALIELGLNPKQLMTAVCETEKGQLHAVLVVDGHLVLDNRHEQVREITDLPYKWIKSMSGKEPGVWRKYKEVQ